MVSRPFDGNAWSLLPIVALTWSLVSVVGLAADVEDGSTATAPQAELTETDFEASEYVAPRSADRRREMFLASLTIFVLAVFVGFELISKVPPTLHTPLMSGSNAISGITLVGALVAAAVPRFDGGSALALMAVLFATINVVGGFLVTHRMLAMFQKR